MSGDRSGDNRGGHNKFDCTPTPDGLPRFNRKRDLDHAEHGTIGADVAPIIKGARNAANAPRGPAHRMDTNKSTGGKNFQASLGAEASGTSTDLKTGARAPKADYGFLRKG